jgi:hypothetical protein
MPTSGAAGGTGTPIPDSARTGNEKNETARIKESADLSTGYFVQ